jgi:hypothetical protein
LCRSKALVSDIIAPLHFANDPMQQARSDHFVLAKLRRDVLKHGVAGGLRYGFGGLHQPVEFVSGQSQSQLVQWGHGKCSAKNKNAATGLWFSDCISPFRRMHPRARHAVDPAPGAAKAPFSCSRASSGKDLHRLFVRSLRGMPRMAAVTTERKTDQPDHGLLPHVGFVHQFA